jgi:hypothetical protein
MNPQYTLIIISGYLWDLPYGGHHVNHVHHVHHVHHVLHVHPEEEEEKEKGAGERNNSED